MFAIRDIEEGTNIFANDQVGLVWVDKADLERIDLCEAHRRLYRDFGIDAGDRIGCPSNFHNLTPGWYLNRAIDPAQANVRADSVINFIAARDIANGEELTINYDELNLAGHLLNLK